MKNKDKINNKKRPMAKGAIIGAVLMMIGAGAAISYFSSQKNRSKSADKAKDLGNYLIERIKSENESLTNKAKRFIRRINNEGKNMETPLSKYGKTTL